jgi:hypothetical protein
MRGSLLMGMASDIGRILFEDRALVNHARSGRGRSGFDPLREAYLNQAAEMRAFVPLGIGALECVQDGAVVSTAQSPSGCDRRCSETLQRKRGGVSDAHQRSLTALPHDLSEGMAGRLCYRGYDLFLRQRNALLPSLRRFGIDG